jgi:hypothetical protein
MVSEMHASFIRAHNAQVAAARATIEFEEKWVSLFSHFNNVVELIGADAFMARFTEDNTTPDFLHTLNALVAEYNDVRNEYLVAQAEDNPATFVPQWVNPGEASSSGEPAQRLPLDAHMPSSSRANTLPVGALPELSGDEYRAGEYLIYSPFFLTFLF